jgi:NitT/TauT family transport system substrate-binding protein
MPKRGIVAIVLVGFIAIVALFAWKLQLPNPPKPAQRPLRVAVVTWVGFGPFYIAADKGFFKQEGLDVNLVRIDDFAARRAALASGDLDGSVETIDSLAVGAAQGLPAKLVLIVDESFGGDGIVVRKEIQGLADLRGKTVAVAETTPSHFFLLYLMEQAGVSSRDFRLVPMEAGDAGAAFVAKKVDAAVTWEPWLSQANSTSYGKVLTTTADHPGVIADTFVVHPNLIERDPAAVVGLLRAWFHAVDYVNTNKADALNIMSKHLDLPQAELEGMLHGVRFPKLEQNIAYFEPAGSTNRFEELFASAIRIWKSAGEIQAEKPIDTKSYYDASFLRRLR